MNLKIKFKRMRDKLKAWNKETFGNIYDHLQQAEKEADQAERKYDDEGTEHCKAEMNRTKIELILWLKREEMHYRQLSSIKWYKTRRKKFQFFSQCDQREKS